MSTDKHHHRMTTLVVATIGRSKQFELRERFPGGGGFEREKLPGFEGTLLPQQSAGNPSSYGV